jgi:hypothetical protein
VRNVRIGAGHLHANAPFATLERTVTAYDFDPTTSAKKSDKTRLNNKEDRGFTARGSRYYWEDMNVFGADSRRAEIVWGL